MASSPTASKSTKTPCRQRIWSVPRWWSVPRRRPTRCSRSPWTGTRRVCSTPRRRRSLPPATSTAPSTCASISRRMCPWPTPIWTACPTGGRTSMASTASRTWTRHWMPMVTVGATCRSSCRAPTRMLPIPDRSFRIPCWSSRQVAAPGCISQSWMLIPPPPTFSSPLLVRRPV